jgi:hypothetical protein
MTAEENKIFEDAILLQKTTTWWMNKTSEILDEIDRVERKEFSLAKKRLEEDKIDEILSRIDKIKE